MTTDPDQFAIIPVYTDSTGRKAVPGDAVFVGSRTAVMERILDSKTRRECFTLLNDAKRIREEARDVAAEKRDVAARADAVTQAEDLIRKLCDAVNTLRTRVDAFEEEQRAKADAEERARNEEPITLPPGTPGDEGELDEPKHPLLDAELGAPIADHGELQATHPPSDHPEYEEDPEPELSPLDVRDSDGDPGAVLPQAPIPPSDKHYDPHPEPNSTWKS